MTTIGTLIRTQRQKNNISIWRLGKMTGFGITHIKRIEDGVSCRFSTALKLLDALEVKTIKIQEFDLSK